MTDSIKKNKNDRPDTWSRKALSLSHLSISKARELLHAEGNHIKLINSVTIFVLTLIFPLLIVGVLSYVVNNNVILNVVYFALLIFTAMPIMSCIVRIAGMTYINRPNDLTEMFYGYSSIRSYGKAIFMSVISVLKLITPVSLGFLIGGIAYFILRQVLSLPESILPWCILIWAVTSIALYLPVLRLYATLYLVIQKNMGFPEAVRTSWNMTKGNLLEIIKLQIRLIPLTVASVIPVGMPLVLYTVPYRICVYCIACEKMKGASVGDKSEVTEKSEDGETDVLAQEKEINNDMCPLRSAEDVEEINE